MIIDEPADTITETTPLKEEAISLHRYKALIIAGICLSLMLRPYLGQFFLIWDMSYTQRVFMSDMLEWVVTAIMFLYAWYAEGNKFFLWPEKRYNAGFFIGSVIVVFLMYGGASMISRIPFYLGFHENNDLARKMAAVLSGSPLFLVFTCLTAGIIEELIFRVYILSRLSLFFTNKHWPVIISALIFASVHIAYKTVHELIFVFLIGLIFGYYYQRYRNITVLVIVHFAIDFIAFNAYHQLHK